MPMVRHEWMLPSERPCTFGIADQRRWRARARLPHDGHIIWEGWFDDREDFDQFIWGLRTRAILQEPYLWGLCTPNWDPFIGEVLIYYFDSVDFLTSSPGTDQNYTVPVDWDNNNNSIEGIGGGGSGGNGGASGSGEGGSGGEYRKAAPQALTPGSTVTRNVGAGGATPSASIFKNNSSTIVMQANGGTKGANNALTATGPAGGTGGTGSAAHFDGGRGGGPGTGGNAGGGGGGAGGPNGAGAAGGDTPSSGQAGGAGGGGNGGGSAGSAGTSVSTGGAGGNNYLGSGSGAGGTTTNNGTAGTNGGAGGGGGTVASGGAGSTGQEWDATHGSGSGGGAAGQSTGAVDVFGGDGGLYGGAGGGAAYNRTTSTGGVGKQGIIVVTNRVAPPMAFKNKTSDAPDFERKQLMY